jgi:Na+-driven multidrug efflux pump
MMLPGLVSAVFYRRRPSGPQVAGSVALTVALSALLGYVLPPGPLGRWGSVAAAIGGALALYGAILAYLVYVYQPMRAQRAATAPPGAPP